VPGALFSVDALQVKFLGVVEFWGDGAHNLECASASHVGVCRMGAKGHHAGV